MELRFNCTSLIWLFIGICLTEIKIFVSFYKLVTALAANSHVFTVKSRCRKRKMVKIHEKLSYSFLNDTLLVFRNQQLSTSRPRLLSATRLGSTRLGSARVRVSDTVSCDSWLRHRIATLIYRQNEALLSDRGDLVVWSGTRSFGEPPAQRQWHPRRRAQGWSAEPGSGGPGGPGVGADGQHACLIPESVHQKGKGHR